MRGEYPAAMQSFEEATYSAADYSDYGVLEEAFRYAALTHLITNRKGFYAPLQSAMQWAKGKDLRQLRASLALCAAENYSVLEQIKDAAAMLDDARMVLSQRRAMMGRLGGRFSYLSAQILFQQTKNQEGQAAFTSAMNYMKHGSRRLFQIALADNLYTSGTAPARTAMDYYNELLRDPLPERLDDRSHGNAGDVDHAASAFAGALVRNRLGPARIRDGVGNIRSCPAAPIFQFPGHGRAIGVAASGFWKRPPNCSISNRYCSVRIC